MIKFDSVVIGLYKTQFKYGGKVIKTELTRELVWDWFGSRPVDTFDIVSVTEADDVYDSLISINKYNANGSTNEIKIAGMSAVKKYAKKRGLVYEKKVRR